MKEVQMLNDKRLKALLTITENATPGPWQRGGEYWTDGDVTAGGTRFIARCSIDSSSIADAEHIAAFDPSTCAELVREVVRLREEVEDLSLNVPPGRLELI